MVHAKEGRASQREKLRQARDAAGRADASVSRLLSLVESGVMEPDAPELRERLVALRPQKSELGRDISRLQDNLQTGELELSPEKLKTLSMEMRKRLAKGPPELRQAYMRLLLENVTVDHDSIRLEGSPSSWRSSPAGVVKVVSRSSLYCSGVACRSGQKRELDHCPDTAMTLPVLDVPQEPLRMKSRSEQGMSRRYPAARLTRRKVSLGRVQKVPYGAALRMDCRAGMLASPHP